MTSDPALPRNIGSRVPVDCAIAFKEWAGVCASIASGQRSLILRKGGVSEGPAGFQPEHPAFWLYPTHVHEAEQGLKTFTQTDPIDEPGIVRIDTLAVVAWVERVETLDQLDALADFHDWTDETVRKRFAYRTPGLWALAVLVYRRPEAYRRVVLPADLGCKTWVPLEQALSTEGLLPALDPEASTLRLGQLRDALEGARS
jgi:hypothetical protein